MSSIIIPPSIVFIVPYRDREAHLNCFLQTMKFLLTELDESIHYEIVVSEQGDMREFNRGAMKNLGFLYIKNKYPKHYKNMTFVFNDVDTFPGVKGILPYYVIDNPNIVKHFYGFEFALGGVFSITGRTFETVNGFPNYWGWGFEDNCLQKRLTKSKFVVNRENFYFFNDNNWINLFHGFKRKLDENILTKFNNDISNKNGLSTIKCNFTSDVNINVIDVSINAYKVSFKNWSVPEDVNSISFEINDNPTRIFQKKNRFGMNII